VVSAKNSIHIERDVVTAHSTLMMDYDCAHEDRTPPICEQAVTEGGRIRIGQGSWIGQGAALVCTRGDLVLGRVCVVGANALVTRSFPLHSITFGNPATVIKHFDGVRNTWVLGCAETAETALTKQEHASMIFDWE
jgi:acetyltransferase-like isoleucine patch superfamily enzyme